VLEGAGEAKKQIDHPRLGSRISLRERCCARTKLVDIEAPARPGSACSTLVTKSGVSPHFRLRTGTVDQVIRHYACHDGVGAGLPRGAAGARTWCTGRWRER